MQRNTTRCIWTAIQYRYADDAQEQLNALGGGTAADGNTGENGTTGE